VSVGRIYKPFTDPTAAYAEAERRIAIEAKALTGTLELSRLALTELPPALWELQHLQKLSIGQPVDDDGKWTFFPLAKFQLSAIPREIRELHRLERLSIVKTWIKDLESIAGITNLQFLDCSGTKVADLTPLQRLTNLQSLKCTFIQVADLTPLQRLTNLQSLDCRFTPVADLTPLQGLMSLKSLEFSSNEINDLTPLKGLTNLRSLEFSSNEINDLTPLKGLTNLRSLGFSSKKINDLTPLKGLTNLRILNLSLTKVVELSPLQGLTNLRSLNFYNTQIADLTPLQGLTNLQSLCCPHTPVADLSPLQGLTRLKALDCGNTGVTHLDPLIDLPALETAQCNGLKLVGFPAALLSSNNLRKLNLYRSTIRGIPDDVIPSDHREDSLPALRAHFADLAQGAVPARDAKLLVLGNGGVGKTQLCRRLRGESFQAEWDSTHGIRVTSAKLPLVTGEKARLHIWDFGGQDLYHGTHALFMKTASLFLILWTPEGEAERERECQGQKFRDHSVSWWLDYVRHTSGGTPPLLIVRGQADLAKQTHPRAPVPLEALQFFEYCRELCFSANGRGGDEELLTALRTALGRHFHRIGQPMIGRGRQEVIDRIAALRHDDGAMPSELRLITRETFDAWCQDAGDISDPAQFLQYLHNAGLVYWRAGLFQDRIILDHGWLLAGIYAPFDRARAWQELKDRNGRFSRSFLAKLVWNEAGHSVADQRLFLSMMRDCGIAFVHRTDNRYDPDLGDTTEYIAPELLPERADMALELQARWGADPATANIEWAYGLLHPGVVAGVIAWIGEQAGVSGLYWRDGAHAFDGQRHAHALVEAIRDVKGGIDGILRLSVRGGDHVGLLDVLGAAIDVVNQRLGLKPRRSAPPAPPRIAPVVLAAKAEPAEPDAPKFTRQPTTDFHCYVSYKRGDDTPKGKELDATVNRLMVDAQREGLRIDRDNDVLSYNESITEFMEKLADGQRIFILLSEEYLLSPFCTFELAEIWRISQQDPTRFRNKVRVFSLDCAKPIREIAGAKRYWTHWKNEAKKQAKDLKGIPVAELPELLRKRHERADFFARNCLKILSTFADTLVAKDWDTFIKYGFKDIPPTPP
jgi:internalin A